MPPAPHHAIGTTRAELVAGLQAAVTEAGIPFDVPLYWTGRSAGETILVQFVRAEYMQLGWVLGFELEISLGQTPAKAQEMLDTYIDFFAAWSEEWFDSPSLEVVIRQMGGVSKASGSERTVLVVSGTVVVS